ncbi:MAG: hypothetical protein IT439_06180 [Phycisphaerales bacterium]|nr:hypothetical protein [Phycisphaerales bacterium]
MWEGYSPAFNDARREFALLADRSVGVDVTLLEHIASLAMGETTYPGLDGRDEASALRVLALDALALRAGMPESDDTVTSRCIEVAVALAYNGDRSLRLAAASAAWTLMSTRRSPRDRAGDSALNAMVRDLANDEDRFVRVLAYAASPRS